LCIAQGEEYGNVLMRPERGIRFLDFVIGYLASGGSSEQVFATARRLIIRKCRDSHDFKYGFAAWEECSLASDPRWRAPLVAATMYKLSGGRFPDSPLMIRAREAVKNILG
jgi:hypothetical protein